eukprot:Ihof_evm4s10 gene=Ihof_evmTU4s10
MEISKDGCIKKALHQLSLQILLAHKASALGERYVERAKQLQEHNLANNSRIQNVKIRLYNAHQCICLQVSLLDELNNQLVTRSCLLEEIYQTSLQDHRTVQYNIRGILKKMELVNLEPELISDNLDEMDDKNDYIKTLYDFVDEESLFELDKRATVCLTAIERSYRRAMEIVVLLKDKADILKPLWIEFDGQAIPLDLEGTRDSECYDKQERLIHDMEVNLNSIRGHRDNLTCIYRPYEHDWHSFPLDSFDKNGFLTKTQEIRSWLHVLYSQLNTMLHNSEALRKTNLDTCSIYSTATNILNELKVIALTLEETLHEWTTLEITFTESGNTLTGILSEYERLTDWYQRFYTAYPELLQEIMRRNQAIKRVQELRKEYQERLDAVWIDETHRRDVFHQSFGIYLPEQLCPAIKELAPQLKIVSTFIGADLPELKGQLPRKEQ